MFFSLIIIYISGKNAKPLAYGQSRMGGFNETHAFTLNRAFPSAVKTTFTQGLVCISRHAPDIKLGKVITERWPVNQCACFAGHTCTLRIIIRRNEGAVMMSYG